MGLISEVVKETQLETAVRCDGDVMEVVLKDFSSDQLEALARKGQALRVAGKVVFPTPDAGYLAKAFKAFGRGANAGYGPKLKSYLKRRAKALGRGDLVPDSWK